MVSRPAASAATCTRCASCATSPAGRCSAGAAYFVDGAATHRFSTYHRADRSTDAASPTVASKPRSRRAFDGSHTHPGARTCSASFRLRGRCRSSTWLTTSATNPRPRSSPSGTGIAASAPRAPGRSPLQPLHAGPLRRGEEEGLSRRLRPGGEELHPPGAVLHVDPGQQARRAAEGEQEAGPRDAEEQETLPVPGPHDPRWTPHRHRQSPGEGEGQALGLRLRLSVPLAGGERLLLPAGRGRRAGRRHRPGQHEAGEPGGVGCAGLEEGAGPVRVHAQEVLPPRGAPDAGQVEDHVAPPHRGRQAPGLGDVAAGQRDVQAGEGVRLAPGPDQGPDGVPPIEQPAGEPGPQESVGTRHERAHRGQVYHAAHEDRPGHLPIRLSRRLRAPRRRGGRPGPEGSGRPEHPYSQGSLCPKVNGYERSVHAPGRLTTPFVRAGAKGEGKFRRSPGTRPSRWWPGD